VKTTFLISAVLDTDDRDEITLASPDELVFFHELAHAAHKGFSSLVVRTGSRKSLLSCCTGPVLYHRKETRANGRQQLQLYPKYALQKLSPVIACVKVLSDVERS
jgi:hypothetical protein